MPAPFLNAFAESLPSPPAQPLGQAFETSQELSAYLPAEGDAQAALAPLFIRAMREVDRRFDIVARYGVAHSVLGLFYWEMGPANRLAVLRRYLVLAARESGDEHSARRFSSLPDHILIASLEDLGIRY